MMFSPVYKFTTYVDKRFKAAEHKCVFFAYSMGVSVGAYLRPSNYSPKIFTRISTFVDTHDTIHVAGLTGNSDMSHAPLVAIKVDKLLT